MTTKTSIGTSNNNPITKYTIEGTNKFVTGVDNDDDKYKISTGSTLDSPALEIDNNGNVTIKNNLVVQGTQQISNSTTLLSEDSSINLGIIDSNPITGITESANNSGKYIVNVENDISSGITVGSDNLLVSDVVFTSSGGSTGDQNSSINKTHVGSSSCDNSFSITDYSSAASSFSSGDSNFTNSYSSVSGKKVKLSATALPNIKGTLSSGVSSSATSLSLSNVNTFQASANGNSSTDTSDLYIYETTSTTDQVISKSGTTDTIVQKSGTSDVLHGATSTTDTIWGASNTTNTIVEKSGTSDAMYAVDNSITNTIVEKSGTTDTMYAVDSSITNTIVEKSGTTDTMYAVDSAVAHRVVEKTSTENRVVEKSGTTDTMYPVDSAVAHRVVEKTNTENRVVEKSGTTDTMYPVDSAIAHRVVEKTSTENRVVEKSGTTDTMYPVDSAVAHRVVEKTSTENRVVEKSGTTDTMYPVDSAVSHRVVEKTSTENRVVEKSGTTDTMYPVDSAVAHRVVEKTSTTDTIMAHSGTSTTLSVAISDDSTSPLTISVASVSGLSTSDYLLIDTEIMQISSISGTDITVTRGSYSTSLATHTISSAVIKVNDLTSSSTTIYLISGSSASSFYNGSSKYAMIESEVVQITARSTNQLTIGRNQLSTTEVSHSINSTITLLQDISSVSSSTLTLLTTGSITSYSASNQIVIDNELMTISSVDNTNKELAVTRSSPATHTIGKTITKITTDGGTHSYFVLTGGNFSSFTANKYVLVGTEVVKVSSVSGTSGQNMITLINSSDVRTAQYSTSSAVISNGSTATLLNDAITDTSSNITLTMLDTSEAGNFASTNYLLINNEVLYISSKSTYDITVTKENMGTSSAAHSNNDTITLLQDISSVSSSTLTLLTTGSITSYSASNQIVIDNELMTISSVDNTNKELAVTRSSPATHTIGKTITKITTDSGTHSYFVLTGGNFSSFTANKYVLVGTEVVKVSSVSGTSGQNMITLINSSDVRTAQYSTSSAVISNGSTATLLNDAITDTSSNITLTMLDTSEAGNFASTNYLLINNEVLYISSKSTYDITVTKENLGTSSAAHSNNDTITLLQDITSASSSTLKLLTTGSITSYSASGQIVIDNELMTISSVDNTNKELAVTRSSPATHTIGKTITKITTDGGTHSYFALTGGNFSSFTANKYVLVGTEVVKVSSVSGTSGQNMITLINSSDVRTAQYSTSSAVISNGSTATLLNDAITDTSSNITLTMLDTSEAGNFASTNYILINNEVLYISSKSTYDITVTKENLGTSSAAHSNNDTITLLQDISSVSSSTLKLLTTGSITSYSASNQIVIDNELMTISSVDNTNKELAVTRSSPATHTIGKTITKITTDGGTHSYFVLTGGNFSSFTANKYILVGTEVVKVSSASGTSGQNMITLINSSDVRTAQYSTSSAVISNGSTATLLNDAITDTSSNITLTMLDTSEAGNFASTNYLLINNEVLYISSKSTYDITVTKENMGTSSAAHSNNDTITLLQDISSVSSSTLKLLTTGSITSYSASGQIVIDNELMTISSVDNTNKELAVTRSSPATHTIGKTITKITTDGGTHSYFALTGGNFSSFTANKYVLVGTEVVKVSSVSGTSGQNMITLINSSDVRTAQYSTSSAVISNGSTATLLNDAITDTSSNITLTMLDTSEAGNFASTNYILINNEVLYISSKSTYDITVTKENMGTSSAAHSNNDTITLLQDISSVSSSTLKLLTTGSITSYSASGQIVIDNELMTISSVDNTNKELAVTRSSPATHSIGKTITKITTDSSGSQTTFVLTGGDFSSFTVNKYSLVSSEVVKVSSVSSTSGQNMITVSRSQLGTSAAAISNGTTNYLLQDNITSSSSSTLTLLTTSSISSSYSDADQIVVNSEVMIIASSGVDNTNKELTVTRSSPTTHSISGSNPPTITKITTDSGTHSYFVLTGSNFASFTANKYVLVGSEVVKVSSASATNGQNMITLINSSNVRTAQFSTSSATISNSATCYLLNDNITSSSSSTLTLLTTASISSSYSDADQIVVNSEIMTIASSGVDNTNKELTVTRSSPTTHSTSGSNPPTITKITTDSGTHSYFVLVGDDFSNFTDNKYILVGSEVVKIDSDSDTNGQNMITLINSSGTRTPQFGTSSSSISNGTTGYLLNDTISSGGTTLEALGSGASSFDNTHFLVDTEIIQCGSGGVSGNTLSVSRGRQSTSQATHTNNSTITSLYTGSESTFNSSNTYLALVGGNYDNMKTVGDKIVIDTEIVEITANSSNSKVITVTRGASSTTAASHSHGATGRLLESSISTSNTLLALVSGNYASFTSGKYVLIDNEVVSIDSLSSNIITVTRESSGTAATHSNGVSAYLLNSTISSSGTTLEVISGNISSTGDILMDDEVLTVSSVSSRTLTVTRATGNSTAATHSHASTTTSLNSISSSTTSIELNDGTSASSFSAGKKLLVNNEVLNISSRSGNVLTVTRGQYGTIAKSITSGTTVTILTAESATVSSNDIVNGTVTISSGLSNSYTTSAVLLRKVTSNDFFYLSSVSSNSALSLTYNSDGVNTSGDYITLDTNYSGTLSLVGQNFLTIDVGVASCTATVTGAFIGKSTTNTSKGTHGINFNYYSSSSTDKSKAIRLDADSTGTGGSLLFSDTISGTLTDYFKFDFNGKASSQYYDTNNYLTTTVGSDGSTTMATTGTTGNLTLDIVGDLNLNADGGNVYLQDGSTTFLDVNNSSGDAVLQPGATTKDIIFKSHSSDNSGAEIGRLDSSASSLLMASGKQIQFADTGEYISGDGTDLTLASGGDIKLTASTSVEIPANIELYLDGTNHSDYLVSDDTNVTLACGGGDITLDANGANVYLKDNGTTFMQFTNDGSGGVTMTNTTGDYVFSSSSSTKPVLQILNTNADGNSSELKFNKTSSSEYSGDSIGQMTFYGYDSIDASTKYVYMEGKSKTVTNNSEDGSLIFNALVSGTNRQFIDLNETTADTVTIGTVANNVTLDVKGSIISASDIRLKENIKNITSPLEIVSKLHGVSFNFKNNKNVEQYGLIAQEVENVLPNLVQTDNNGYKSINYQNTIAFLIEAIKEQQQEINKLKKNN